MTIVQGAVLGLVQGIGEFLPISSSAHMLLVSKLLGVESSNAFKVFEVLLHVATLLPILIYFWKDWIDMLMHPIKNHTLGLLILASMPALLFYVLFDMDALDSGWCLGPMFMLTAVLLLLIDIICHHRNKSSKTVFSKNALAMGFLQGLGLFPGVSRLGSTLFGGVISGLSRKTAAKFSFMMSAPAVVASFLVEGKHAMDDNLFSEIEMVPTLVGCLIAAVIGFFALMLFMKIVTRVPMTVFSVYLALLGVTILVLQIMHSPLLPAFQAPEGMQLIRFLQ